MIKKLTKTIVVGTLVMSLGIVNVFANSYKGYVLPARQGNNYTGAHSKTTTSNYITNKVTDVENAGTVTFWAANKDEKYRFSLAKNVAFPYNGCRLACCGYASAKTKEAFPWGRYTSSIIR